jgi:hypothetical protein
VGNKEVLQRSKEERDIVHTGDGRKGNCIGHMLRKDCLLKHVSEGKIEGRVEIMGIQGKRRRRKQLLADLTEMRGYCKLKEEALDRTVWRSRFGRGCGPIARKTTKRLNTPMCCRCLLYGL